MFVLFIAAVALCFRLGGKMERLCYGIVTAAFCVDDLRTMKIVVCALIPFTAFAQQPTVAPAAGVLGRGAETLYGPMVSAAVEVRGGDGVETPLALRGILFRPIGGGPKAWGCFDVDRRALVGMWSEAELEFGKSNLGTYKGLGTGAVVVRAAAPSLSLPPGDADADWLGLRVSGPRVIFCFGKRGVSYDLIGGRIVSAEAAGQLSANWPETIVTQGVRVPDDSAYVADTIALPDENPWKCWLRPSGLDFLPDGKLAICTLSGDVWVASGLDEKLARVSWRRFAGGLREPLGLRVVDGKIIVGCRDQITCLHDTNNDGEADFYENVNAGRTLVPNFHAFAYDLQTDAAGDFIFGTGGNQLGADEPWHGKLWRASADGRSLRAIASGFRAPNGITTSPLGDIYVAENQGHWIPSSKISRVREGGFYGYVADPKTAPKAKAPASFDPPMLYLPMTWDNSSGGGEFCPPGLFGPLGGRLMHTSFGAAALFALFEQRVGGLSQGAAVKLPLTTFESGIMRARLSPDDALYVCGLKGWQSKAVRDGCLARVRYTGKPATFPVGWRVEKDAMILTFDTPLDPAAASDPQNFAMQQWNYQWHAKYGSPDISVVDPKRAGRDTVEIPAVRVTEDGKTLTVSVPGLCAVMQFLIKANLKTATGTPIHFEVAGTINAIP